jgi:hypothetical protein
MTNSSTHNEKAKEAMRRFRKRFPVYVRQYEKEWRAANPEKRRAIEKKCRDKVRLRVLTHYGGNPPKCKCCGEKHIEFLSIDHINGGGSKERKIYGSKLAYSIIRRGYPKGYRVLCHNCNQALGYYGYCPHKKK